MRCRRFDGRSLLPSTDLFQPAALDTCVIEIRGIEPFLVGLFESGPFLVDDREPSRVAALALRDHMLAEYPLGLEAEPLGGALRGLVAVVALPFPAAIAEIVKCVAHEQV